MEKGNGKTLPNAPILSNFAIADFSTSIIGLSIQIRQILNTLTFSSSNPYFYLLKYGDEITKAQRTQLVAQMSYANPARAIGAGKNVLDSIEAIENGAVDKINNALLQEISLIAGTTRLPLSYYLGEKQTGGLGDTGQSTDELKIMKKKEFILQKFLPILEEVLGTSFSHLYNYYTNKAEEKKKADEEKRKEVLQQSQDEQNTDEKQTVEVEEE